MPLSSQVKSSRVCSSRPPSTWGHFSLKSGHVSVPQRLPGLAQSGVQGQGPLSGGQAEALLVSGRSMEATNLAAFLKFEKAKKIKNWCYLCKKIMGGHETAGAWSKTGRPVPSPPAQA